MGVQELRRNEGVDGVRLAAAGKGWLLKVRVFAFSGGGVLSHPRRRSLLLLLLDGKFKTDAVRFLETRSRLKTARAHDKVRKLTVVSLRWTPRKAEPTGSFAKYASSAVIG
jgi:hypothetical protein